MAAASITSPPQFADQLDTCQHCAAGCYQIIYQQNACARLDGVGMDFYRCFAIFQSVTLRNRIKRQFAFFADGDKADVQLIGQSCANDEAARIQACYDINFLPHIAVNQ